MQALAKVLFTIDLLFFASVLVAIPLVIISLAFRRHR
jgi:hypothetical protein